MAKRADDDEAVELWLHAAVDRSEPPRIRSALRHAVFAGGGRVRPRLALMVARAAGTTEPPPLAYAMAAAVELLHCASLVHDDLPCFDDADSRRGQPTVHRAFGEATAVLTGDALIVSAFDTVARAGGPASAFLTLARAAGAHGGLVSGQALELEDGPVDLVRYHGAKTAALFEAAAELGATSVGANSAPFAALGRAVGLFYQMVDDAADAFGEEHVIGKPIGRDQAHNRPSAMTAVVRGIDCPLDSSEAARRLYEQAAEVLAQVPECPGRRELRTFLAIVFRTLITRAGVEGAASVAASNGSAVNASAVNASNGASADEHRAAE